MPKRKKQAWRGAPVPPDLLKRLRRNMPELVERQQRQTAFRLDYIKRHENEHHLNEYYRLLEYALSNMQPSAHRDQAQRAQADAQAKAMFRRIHGRNHW